MSTVTITREGAQPSVTLRTVHAASNKPAPLAGHQGDAIGPVSPARIVQPGPVLAPAAPVARQVLPEIVRAIIDGRVNLGDESEGGELLRSAWRDADRGGDGGARWNGWQAAAWIATHDLATVRRLSSAIELRGPVGGALGLLTRRAVEGCLRWTVATEFCRCKATRIGACTCVDRAFATLNDALFVGAVYDLSSHRRDPVMRDNALRIMFEAAQIAAPSFLLDPLPATPAELTALLDRYPPMSKGAAFQLQAKELGARKWKREAFLPWAEANRPKVPRGRPKAKAAS